MRARWAAIGLAAAGAISAAGAGVELGEGVTVTFLSGKEGGKFLATPDDFTKSLSPFDRSVRLRVGRTVGEEEFLKHVRANAIDWTGQEKRRLRLRLGEIREKLKGLELPWSKTIFFIKTTGNNSKTEASCGRPGFHNHPHSLPSVGLVERSLHSLHLFTANKINDCPIENVC